MLTESFGGNEEEGLKHFLQAYLACIAFADEQAGVVLDALNNSRFKENTIVILTSDHGWQMGEKQYLFKNSPWETSTNIPLLIKVPGMEQNKEVKQPVSLIDIFPTLKDLCQLVGDNRKTEAAYPLGGFSLKPFVENADFSEWEGAEGTLTAIATDSVNYELSAQTFLYRTKDYRYVLYPNGSEELYDLNNDPYEWNNCIQNESYSEKKLELRSTLFKLINN